MMWAPPQKQVDAALRVLKPPRAACAEARKQIEMSLAEVRVSEADGFAAYEGISKEKKIAARRLHSALQRATAAAKKLSRLDPYWSLFPLDLSASLARCERQLAEPARAPRRSARAQKSAVAAARELIETFGDEKDLRLTRKNAWHRLSAILYGKPQADLLNVMRSMNRDVKKRSSKRGV